MLILRKILSQALLAAFLLATPVQAEARPLLLTTTQLYATSGTTLYRVDQHTGALKAVGDLGVSISSMAYDQNHDILYGLGYNQGYNLYVIDRRHAKVRFVGPTTYGNFAYDNHHDVLYVGGGLPGLSTINPHTGEATVIGGFLPLASGLAFDGQGTLWSSDEDRNGIDSISHLSVIDTNAGTIKSSMVCVPNLDAISFEPFTGSLYGVVVSYGDPVYTLNVISFYKYPNSEFVYADGTFVGHLPGFSALAFAIDGPHIERIP